jgi:hypothetical protein
MVRGGLCLAVALFAMNTVAYGQCPYVLFGTSSTAPTEFTSAGGTTAPSLDTEPGCPWTVTDVPSWVTVLNGTSGTGDKMIQMSIAPNTSTASRSALITIGGPNNGRRFPLFQTGVPLMLTPMQPCRIADTRGGNFAAGFGPPFMPAGSERSFNIRGSGCNVPSTARAYSLNITIVPRGGPVAYILAWPTGGQVPIASTLNSFDGRVVANAAIVSAGVNGAVSIYVHNDTDVIIDINGYFTEPPGGLAFYPVTPCRVMDTRASQGFSGAYGPPALAANTTRSISMTASNCGLPPTAAAYSVNVTALPTAGPLIYMVAWAAGQPLPPSSTLNSFTGTVVANAAIVPAGSGSISLYASNPSDVIVDVNGYFAPAGGQNALSYHPVTPCRISDTRGVNGFSGPFGPPAVTPYSARTVPARSSACGIPALALAYVLNATAVPTGRLDFLTVQPSGAPFLGVSTLNAFTGQVTANMAIVPAGTLGSVDLYTSQFSNVILDLNGYFTK